MKAAMDYAAYFDAALAKVNDGDSFAVVLRSQERLATLFRELHVDQPHPYFADQFSEILAAFYAAERELVEGTLEGSVDLTVMCAKLAAFIFATERNIALKRSPMLASVGTSFELTADPLVKMLLSQRQRCERLHLMGFGFGSGLYEANLKHYLLQVGLAQEVVVFGYDPFATSVDGVTQLVPEQFAETHFDIIVARWALHHVRPDERWNIFVSALDRLNPEGQAIIVEHAFDAAASKVCAANATAVTFLNAAADVVANVGIVPDWVLLLEVMILNTRV